LAIPYKLVNGESVLPIKELGLGWPNPPCLWPWKGEKAPQLTRRFTSCARTKWVGPMDQGYKKRRDTFWCETRTL